jgi:hypothetical protein
MADEGAQVVGEPAKGIVAALGVVQRGESSIEGHIRTLNP